jgi:shikimate kinase
VSARTDANLVLIGMPGAGKSTVGRCLAEALEMAFLDTDDLIEKRWGRTLQEIIDVEGLNVFRRKEEETILSLDVMGCVIATGGSVVYSPRAMDRLRRLGGILWLDLPLDQLETRLEGATEDRGIVRQPKQSIADLYHERQPLYQRYAQLRVTTHGKTDEKVAHEILGLLSIEGLIPCSPLAR